MEKTAVLAQLKEYLETEVLRDTAIELTDETPLLEWGILTSLMTAQLVGHIRESYGLYVPAEKVVGAHFRNLDSITDLVLELDGDPHARI